MEPDLNLIYQTLLDTKKDIGKLESKVDNATDEIKTVSISHYRLKNDYHTAKTKVLTFSGNKCAKTMALRPPIECPTR